MKRTRLGVEGAVLGFAFSSFTAACSGSGAHASTGSDAPTGSSGATVSATGAGASGATTAAGATGATTSGAAPVSGSTGATAGASSGAGTEGTAGVSSGADVGPGADAGSSTDMDGGSSDSDIGGDGPVAVAGCANNNYPLCLDFEDGIDTTIWTGGTASAITTADAAHGTHSYRLYPMSGGLLTVKQLGPITNQLWGRFYVHFVPEAPGGHGNILGAYDQSNNWYEIGWQFNGILGDYHLSGGNERPLRSMPYLVDQWYCIESFFDGTQTNMPVWWINGQVPDFYMPDNTTLIPKLVTQFAKITVGFTPYAGLGIPQMPYGNSGPPALTNMYIDDIAFDTKRIGCIQ